MKITDLLEDGRIVKGVNTTVDVDVNEIPRQAEKFGNKVDKDGRPPTLSKKVKGKSTNVLYNLGMVKEQRYTAAEWAIMEGGHTLEETAPQPKKPGRIFAALTEDVEIDNKDGWGAVPWNQEVDYRGLRIKMKPSVFEKLAASRGGEPAVDKVVQHIKSGGSIGAPFLQIRVDDDDSQIPEVVGHEGRSRMLAIAEAHGDVPVETHLFFQGKVNRARHITPEFIEKIQRYLISENDVMIRGPLFEI